MIKTPRVVYLVEGKSYSRSDLFSQLAEREVDELLRQSHLEILPNGCYKFRFVGLLALNQSVCCIVPKVYESSSDLAEEFSYVIRALRKYAVAGRSQVGELDFLNSDPNDPQCSFLPLVDFILRDYFHNGIYYPGVVERVQGMAGRPDWQATVIQIDPFFSRHFPIYTERINEIHTIDVSNVISRVHEWAVASCAAVFSGMLGYDQLRIEGEMPVVLPEIGDPEHVRAILQKALSYAYGDRECMLLRALISLVEGDIVVSNYPSGVFGTREFERVWESIMKEYFVHQVVTSDVASRLMNLPVWHLYGHEIKGKGTIIPDILHLDETSNTLFLFDAKYYNLRINPHIGTISGEPGIKDVFKQFLYEQILEKSFNSSVVNAFLFPISEGTLLELQENGFAGGTPFEVAGRVEYIVFKDRNISVVLLPLSEFAEKYFRNKRITTREFLQLREKLRSAH